jgi:short-subunit dehydrogenase
MRYHCTTREKYANYLHPGASQGLGRELVHAAVARKDRVIATARDISKVQDLERTYNTNGADLVRAMQLDITVSVEELRRKAAEANKIWGRVDTLVNNAGVGMSGISEEVG